MAKDVRFVEVCDPCNHFEISAEAVTTHRLAVDGGPLKEVDVCPRDEEDFQRFLQLFYEGAREVPPPVEEPAPAKKQKPKAAALRKSKEPEKAPAEEATKKPRQVIWCPEPHRTKNGHGSLVTYEDRNSHADVVHTGAHIWDIAWGDPERILNFPCTFHAECMKTGLAFTTQRGVAQHRRSCPLPIIDQGSSEETPPEHHADDKTEGRPTEDQ